MIGRDGGNYVDCDGDVWGEGGRGAGLVANVKGGVGVESEDARIGEL